MDLNPKKKEEEEKQKSIITKFDSDDILEINIGSSWGDGNSDLGNVLWTDRIGKEIIYGLFETVKDEVSWMKMLRDLPNEMFKRTSELICRDFSYSLKNESKTVEQALKEKLDDLKKFRFAFNTKINFENEKNIRIDPTTLLTPDQIKEKLISLRKQRIEFYKALLKEYLQQQREYDEKIEKELKFYPELRSPLINEN